MTDTEEIQRLIARYCHLCDDGRFDEFAALFAPDAEFAVMGTVHVGRDAIKGFMSKAQGPEARGKHVTSNCLVDVAEAATTATAATDYVFVARVKDGGLGITSAGRYHDRFAKGEDGAWRFARREIVFLGDEPTS